MTVFTKIINRELATDIVYEDEFCLAFKDINPQAPVHILLIPKKEIRSSDEIQKEDQALMGHLMTVVPKITKLLGLSSYRLVVNTGEDAGQTVFHIHIHILGGRKLHWPPG